MTQIDPNKLKTLAPANELIIDPRKLVSVSSGGDPNLFQGNIQEFEENFIPTGGFDALRRQRAIRQSTVDQLGNAAAQTTLGIGLGILENAGYIAELPAVARSDKKDYSNALVETAKGLRQDVAEMFPIYRENPNEVIDFTDAAWWIQNGQGLVESIGEFLVTGAGVGGGLGKASQLAGRVAKSQQIAQGLTGASQVATASTLAYTEGAMSGSQIYKETFDKLISEGATQQEANELASRAASKTVRMNTLINTGLNMTGIAPLFSKNGNALIKAGLARETGESTTKYLNRLREELPNIKAELPNIKERLLFEAIQEGIEEEVNVVAEQRGREVGGLSEFKSIAEILSSDEAKLSFALGALGGVGQTAGISAITKTNEVNRQEAVANNTRNRVQETIKALDLMNNKKQELGVAVKEGRVEDAENIKQEMFNIVKDEHVKKGTAENLIQTFREIENVDNSKDLGDEMQPEIDSLNQELAQIDEQLQTAPPEAIPSLEEARNQIQSDLQDVMATRVELTGTTEAMQDGLASNKNDNEYKRIASESIGKIQRGITQYNKFKDRFDISPENIQANVADEAYSRWSKLEEAQDQRRPVIEAKNEILTGINEISATPESQTKFILEQEIAGLESALTKVPDENKKLIQDKLTDKREQLNTLLALDKEVEKRPNIPELSQSTKAIYSDPLKKWSEVEAIVDSNVKTADESLSKLLNDPKEVDNVVKQDKKRRDDIQKEFDKIRQEREAEILKQQKNREEAEKRKAQQRQEQNQPPIPDVEDVFGDSPVDTPTQDSEPDPQGEDIPNPYQEERGEGNDFTNPENTGGKDKVGESQLDDGRFKIINAATALANLFKNYLTDEDNVINPLYPKELVTGNIKVGDKIVLEYDRDLVIEETGDNEFEKINKTKDAYLNLPIKITKNGNNIGYVHRYAWINDTNVAPGIEGENIQKQRKIVTQIREAVRDNNGKFETEISALGGESVISLNPELRSTFDALNNPDLEFGVIQTEGIFNGNTFVETNNTEDFVGDNQGATVVLLPYINNDKKLAVRLSVNTINESDADVISDLIQVYLSNDKTSDLYKIFIEKEDNAIDITTEEGIREVLQDMINVSILDENSRNKIVEETEADGKKYLSIDRDGIHLLENGEYDIFISKNEDGKQQITNHLTQGKFGMFYNINRDKLNSSFNELIKTEEGGYFSTQSNYNRFIQSVTKTRIYENVIRDGDNFIHTYFDNPTFYFKFDASSPTIKSNKEQEEIVKKPTSKLKRRWSNEIEPTEPTDYALIAEDDDQKYSELQDALKFDSEMPIDAQEDIADQIASDLIFEIFGGLSIQDAINIIKEDYSDFAQDLQAESDEAGVDVEGLDIAIEVDNNFDKYLKKALGKLSYLDINVNIDELATEDIEYVEDDSLDSTSEITSKRYIYSGDASFSIDSKHEASKELKRYLSVIQDTRQSVFGDSWVPVDQVFNKLKMVLADTEPNFDTMMNVLQANTQVLPWLENVIKRMKNPEPKLQGSTSSLDAERLRNEFVTIMSNSHYDFKTIKVEHDSKGNPKFKIISSDQNSTTNTIIEQWRNNLKESNLTELKDNKLLINKDKIKAIANELKEFRKDKPKFNTPEERAFLKSFTSKLGIELGDQTINLIYDQRWAKAMFSPSGVIGVLTQKVDAGEVDFQDEFENANPLYNNTSVQRLARLEAIANDTIHSSSFLNSENNSQSAINLNRETTKRFNKLMRNVKFVQDLIKIPFNAGIDQTWLNKLAKDNFDFKKVFSLEVLDGLVDDRGVSKRPTSMTPRQLEISKLLLFNRDQGENTARFAHLVPSKSTTFVFRAPLLEGEYINKDGTPTQSVLNAMYSIVNSEAQRINNVDIYGDAGKKFYFFDSLNDESKNILVGNTAYITEDKKAIVMEELATQLQAMVDAKKQRWIDLNIIKEDGTSDFIIGREKDVDKQVFNYVVNQAWFQYNLFQSFIGDPAEFKKGGVTGTWNNVFKRLTKDLTPGLDIPQGEQKTYLQVGFADTAVISHPDVDATDAQEWVTIQEHFYLLKQLGKIPTKDYNRITSKIKNNKDLSEQELKDYIYIMKPIAAGKRIVTDDNNIPNAEITDYVKSSALPLVPQWTRGTDMDKVRIALEELQERKGINVRASFKSANKLGGARKHLSIFNKEGRIKDFTISEDNYVEQDRSGFGIAQDVRSKKANTTVDGSQQRKLILSALSYLQSNGDIDADSILSRYNDLYEDIYRINRDGLDEELRSEDGSVDIEKLSKALIKEAEERGWNQNDIKALNLKNGKFIMDLHFNNSSSKIESFLQSFVKNSILRLKRTGGSYALTTPKGTEGNSSGFIYSPEYDPSVGLKPSQYVEGEPVVDIEVLANKEVVVKETDPVTLEETNKELTINALELYTESKNKLDILSRLRELVEKGECK